MTKQVRVKAHTRKVEGKRVPVKAHKREIEVKHTKPALKIMDFYGITCDNCKNKFNPAESHVHNGAKLCPECYRKVKDAKAKKESEEKGWQTRTIESKNLTSRAKMKKKVFVQKNVYGDEVEYYGVFKVFSDKDDKWLDYSSTHFKLEKGQDDKAMERLKDELEGI